MSNSDGLLKNQWLSRGLLAIDQVISRMRDQPKIFQLDLNYRRTSQLIYRYSVQGVKRVSLETPIYPNKQLDFSLFCLVPANKTYKYTIRLYQE